MKQSKRVGSFNGSTATGDDVTNERDYGVLQGWNPLQKCLPRISIFLHGAIQSFSPLLQNVFSTYDTPTMYHLKYHVINFQISKPAC